MKKSVLLLFGGVSTEYEISCVSASVFVDNIDLKKYELYKIGITKNGIWYLYNGGSEKMRSKTWDKDEENLIPAIISPCSLHHGIMVLNKKTKTYEIIHIDVALPVLHGKNGEDGTIQGLLSIAGIPYVGCDTYSSAVCMDKITAKLLCEKEGISTAPFIYAKKDTQNIVLKAEQAFDYPVFVKPSNSGSSIGVTKANNRSQLEKGIETAFSFDNKILIEKAIKGREIEVAVLGNSQPLVSECGEVEIESEVYDYETKYILDTAKYHVPALLNKNISEIVRDTALKIYKILDCSGLSRVDFFVTSEGEVIFNEINTIPGFTPISLYPRLMNLLGYDIPKLIDTFIELAYEKI